MEREERKQKGKEESGRAEPLRNESKDRERRQRKAERKEVFPCLALSSQNRRFATVSDVD